LLVMILAFYSFFALMTILRVRNEILLSEQKSKWVRELILDDILVDKKEAKHV